MASIRDIVRLPLPNSKVPARIASFTGLSDSSEHIAVVFGTNPLPLVRMHSECLTGDVLGSRRCDCGPQLDDAVEQFGEQGGVLLYLRQEGRGIGLYEKLAAYALQDDGFDTFEANRKLGHHDDERTYAVGAEMLTALGIAEIDLLTNNPLKVSDLRARGIDVRRVVPTRVHLSTDNSRYLEAKVRVAGHNLQGVTADP